jgi:hypothetical protein
MEAFMDFKDLPKAVRMKKLSWLKAERGRGVPLSSFAQADRDLLHMETSEENLSYWREENECGTTAERWMLCQSNMRSIACALRAKEPTADDEHPLAHILCEVAEEADRLPAVH